jgi:hypothetical protein
VYLFATAGKPFTDGEILKSYITEVVQEVHSEKLELLKTSNLNVNVPVEFKILVEIFHSCMKSHPSLNSFC